MSDEDDYMSDKFLQGAEKNKAPSLVYKKSEKRKIELTKKKELEEKLRNEKKSIHVIEQEKREEGLTSAISSSNKGFALLMKMGYKPGQGIGKEQSGITEPISIDVKPNRSGLGKSVKKKSTPRIRKTENCLDGLNTNAFRDRLMQKKMQQFQESDIYKSQRICQQLDTQNKIESPPEIWYWPPVETTKNTDDESSSEEEDEEKNNDCLNAKEKLEILTKYLREKYFYCIWCGTVFSDEDDLRDNCPGNTRSDH